MKRDVTYNEKPLPSAKAANASHVESGSRVSTRRGHGVIFIRRTYMPYAASPEDAAANMFPMKNHEKRLLVSSRLYQRVIV